MIDNKLYTYGYYHNGFQGVSPNSSLPYNAFSKSPGTGGPPAPANLPTGNVAGLEMNNNYRAWGDVLRVQRDIGPGTREFGTWLTYQTNYRDQFYANATQNFGLLAPIMSMNDTLTTAEPYLLSALDAVDTRVKGLQSGADDYLVKPFFMLPEIDGFPRHSCESRRLAKQRALPRRAC